MQLPPDQVERFYSIWQPLILYVNRRLRVGPALPEPGPDVTWNVQDVFPVREALWANDPIRKDFIAENPAGLSAADLAVVDSWDHRVAGTFSIFRHLKKHSLLIADGSRDVYAVLGLVSPLDEVVPFTPCFVQAVLLPFEGRIIYDSLLMPYNVYLGPGIRRGLNEAYRDAKERGAIITSLGPTPRPASPGEEQAEAREVNARVLEAFRKHLYRSGRGPKVVERDVAAAAAFADQRLATRPEPRSLRDFRGEEVEEYLELRASGGAKEAEVKQARTGLTRLLRFLRDTGRMDYDAACDALDRLKGRG